MFFKKKEQLGCGVGLRSEHFDLITRDWPNMDWFEAISENFMDTGGRPIKILEQVRAKYPIGLHGVSLSIGSVDPINFEYLAKLKSLVRRIEPEIVSDHMCWTGVDKNNLHDLLPLPFTNESVRHVVSRVNQVQEFLERPILLENVSSYLTYQHSTMPEWEFMSSVAKSAGCGILLDINNVYVNAINHNFDPYDYIANIPSKLVGQFHLAGHTDMGGYLFDMHSRPVIGPVWDLYTEAIKKWGAVTTLIEWDEDIPPFEHLVEEASIARNISNDLCGKYRAGEMQLK